MMIKNINRRTWIYILLCLFLLIGMATIFALRQPWSLQPGNNWLWLLLIATGVCSGYLLSQIDGWFSEPWVEVGEIQDPKFPGIALYCVAGSLLLYVWLIFRLWSDFFRWNGTFLPWLISISLMILAGWFIDRLNTDSSKPVVSLRLLILAKPFAFWLEVGGFVLILALAIFLRVYRIDQIPPGIFVDETNGALDALNILQGNLVSPFATGWYQTPNLYMYYMAGIIKIFGANYVSLKIVSLLPAILTVVAVFFLGRLMFGPAAGYSAMFFMAVSRWHLTLSRWGWAELMPPLFLVLALYFLIKGMKNRKALEFMIGGVLCGLMVYTYVASRLAVIIIFLFCIYWLFSNQGGIKKNLQIYWMGLAFFWGIAIIVVSPLLIGYLKDPFTFFDRIQEVNVFNDVKQQNSYQPLLSNIAGHMKFFHQSGDFNGRHNLPGEPELDPFTGLLFLMGLGYSIVRFRDSRNGLLWIWLVFGLAGGILSTQGESPQSFRTIVVIPAIALFCAKALDTIVRGLYTFLHESRLFGQNFLGRSHRISWAALASVGVLLVVWSAAAFWESRTYFGPQANSQLVLYSFNFAENKVAREVVDKIKDQDRVYLTAHFYYFSILNYLASGVIKETTGSYMQTSRPYQLSRPELDVPIPDDGKNATFILDVYYQSLVDYISIFYPESTIHLVSGAGDIPLYIQVDIPQSAIQEIQGLKAKYTYVDGRIENRVVSNILDNNSQTDIAEVEWSGAIRIDKPGFYEFKDDGDLTILLDGINWKGRRYLCNGLYDIKVYTHEGQHDNSLGLSWLLPDGTEEIVPAQVFFQIPPPQVGLIGRYYDNPNWQGEPICAKLTPFFLLSWPEDDLLPQSFSASFSGFINITKPGIYHFVINADDAALLKIDNELVGEGVIPGQPNSLDVTLELQAGYHPIQIDYLQAGGGNALEFYWGLPDTDGLMVPVPPSVLSPMKP